MSVSFEPWGTHDGKPVFLYTIIDEIEVKVSNYGGTVVSVKSPDCNGMMEEVVLGFDSLDGYKGNGGYHGATIGRYANRIRGGVFDLDGVEYKLARNNNSNHLHGGLKGFDKVVWDSEVLEDGVCLTYTSKDGEEGYPGTLNASVTFKVEGDSLALDYHAETDKATVVNLTNHMYLNLSNNGDILDHRLWIDADNYSPVDTNLIPLPGMTSVRDTPFDLREETRIGDRIDTDHTQLERGGGYDHNYVLNQITNPQIRVSDPKSGREVEISTTMPGVQFYSGNFLNGTDIGRDGPINRRTGLCLETQYFPDSPNRPDFPTTTLNPDEKYIEKTVYRFTTSM